MKNIIKKGVLSVFIGLFIVGCGGSSNQPNTPNLPITKQFQLENIFFDFYESRKADEIVYHTPQELKDLFDTKIKILLQERNLLSNDPSMNKLQISTWYSRRFVGDETPWPSDSLRPPTLHYKLEVVDETGKVLRSVDSGILTLNGGMAFNLKIIAASLRDKQQEVEFIESFAKTIVDKIEKL